MVAAVTRVFLGFARFLGIVVITVDLIRKGCYQSLSVCLTSVDRHLTCTNNGFGSSLLVGHLPLRLHLR